MFLDFERSLRLFQSAPNPHIIKIFFYLAIHQPKDDIRGFKINKLQLQFDLKLSRTVFFNSLHWLKDNSFIQEIKLVEESDFMVNPYIFMNDGDKEARIAEWNRRCMLDSQRKIRLRKEKRRRQQKIASQQ